MATNTVGKWSAFKPGKFVDGEPFVIKFLRQAPGEGFFRAMLTHGSLFSGARLLDTGLEQAGFETIWRVELMDGYDITKQDPKRFPRVGLLSGGPPCKETSRVSRLAKRKTNASLWPHMLRFAAELKPEWILVEQPSSVDRHIIASWCEDLQRIGYGVSGRIIDSRHWVPQIRSRWYLIGRLGVTGLELRSHLYPESERQAEKGSQLLRFAGNCPDCLRDGIFTRNHVRTIACMGAGNGVTIPVAEWIGRRIVEAAK